MTAPLSQPTDAKKAQPLGGARPRGPRGAWLAHPLAKPILWLLLAAPAAWLITAAVSGHLGANPAEALIRGLGDWALRLLLLTLAITPLRQATGWAPLLRHRRNVGVAVFIYACLHWLAYLWFDQGFDWPAIWADIAKRPFILVGTLCFALLAPLAATSFNAAIKRLGAARWKRLHGLIYVIAPLALLHFYWMREAKQRLTEVVVYGVVLVGLLGWRIWRRLANVHIPHDRRVGVEAQHDSD